MSRLIESTRSVMESADSGLEKLMDEAIANAEDFDEEEANNAVASVYGKDDPILDEIIQDGIENPEENYDQVPPVQSDEVSSDEYEEGVTMIDSRYTNDFDDATESSTPVEALESMIGMDGMTSRIVARRNAENTMNSLNSILGIATESSGNECWDENNEGWEDNVNDLDSSNTEDLMDDDETTFQPSPTKISTRREMHPNEETLEQLFSIVEGVSCDSDDEACDDDECDDDDIDEGCEAKKCSTTESMIDQLLSIV